MTKLDQRTTLGTFRNPDCSQRRSMMFICGDCVRCSAYSTGRLHIPSGSFHSDDLLRSRIYDNVRTLVPIPTTSHGNSADSFPRNLHSSKLVFIRATLTAYLSSDHIVACLKSLSLVTTRSRFWWTGSNQHT